MNKGGAVAGIAVGDCVQLPQIATQARTGGHQHSSSPFFYQLLHAWGAFGQDAPAAKVQPDSGPAGSDKPRPGPAPRRTAGPGAATVLAATAGRGCVAAARALVAGL